MADEAKQLSEAQILDLEAKYTKIGIVHFDGREFVFRRPSRDEVAVWRRKEGTAEQAQRDDNLANETIVSIDGHVPGPGDTGESMRLAWLAFLRERPAILSHPRFTVVLRGLAGLLESEVEVDLGKGVSIRSAALDRMRKASASGSPGAPSAEASGQTLTGPPSVLMAPQPASS
jgi:hypothetical protein